MKIERTQPDRTTACSHPGAGGPCMPRVSDGRCIWCDRALPGQRSMRIERTTCDLSLAAIDCGFDPRAHDMLCSVPWTARRVGYERDGEARIVVGTLDEIVAELRDAGYSIHVDDG